MTETTCSLQRSDLLYEVSSVEFARSTKDGRSEGWRRPWWFWNTSTPAPLCTLQGCCFCWIDFIYFYYTCVFNTTRKAEQGGVFSDLFDFFIKRCSETVFAVLWSIFFDRDVLLCHKNFKWLNNNLVNVKRLTPILLFTPPPPFYTLSSSSFAHVCVSPILSCLPLSSLIVPYSRGDGARQGDNYTEVAVM